MIAGKHADIKTDFQRECSRRFTDIQLMKTFGWTPQQVCEIPTDIYEDIILVLNKENAKIDRDNKTKNG